MIQKLEVESSGVIKTNSMIQYSYFMKHYTHDLIQFSIQHPFSTMDAWKTTAKVLSKHGERLDKSVLLTVLQEKLLLQKHSNMLQTWQDAINQLAPENATTGTDHKAQAYKQHTTNTHTTRA